MRSNFITRYLDDLWKTEYPGRHRFWAGQPTRRTALADAFRSATGDIYERLVMKADSGPQIFKIYCRDNKAPHGTISRELTDLNDQFTSLRYLPEELRIRVRWPRAQKNAA